MIKEYRNYMWKTDRDGKIINEPDVGFDHSMDAIRYAINDLKPKEEYYPITDSTPYRLDG